MNILLVTPFYYSKDIGIDATPVVNYFAKEWAASGHCVLVVHTPSVFPSLMRYAAKPFKKRIEARLNCTLSLDKVKERLYDEYGATILRHPLNKLIPHSRYTNKQIKNLHNHIVTYCQEHHFSPDVIIGHWVTPSIDIVMSLKHHFKVKAAIVLHNEGAEIKKLYKNNYSEILKEIDVWGFRSEAKKKNFEENYGKLPDSFICYSGIPSSFVGDAHYRKYEFNNKYIFVGVLRERKYPATIIDSLEKVYGDGDYSITYIGEGAEEITIKAKIDEYGIKGEKVKLLGKVAREEVHNQLARADVFVMISRAEAFGLVYLEAMSTGCIPIASRNEGFDGIIVDGINGFLCKAGDPDELSNIIKRICNMSNEELQNISNAAIDTAKRMTDKKVAEAYIEAVTKIK